MLLETLADAFAAAGLAEIRDRGGNLEWTVQLLFGTQRIVGHEIVAGADHAGGKRRPGWQDIEFDGPLIAEHLRCERCGSGRQRHQGDIARARCRLTARLGD